VASRPQTTYETTVDIRDIINDVRARRTPRPGRGRVVSRTQTRTVPLRGVPLRERVSKDEATWEGLKSAALMGGGDEIQAFGGGLGSLISGRGFNAGYDAELAAARARRDQAWEEQPEAYGVGYVPGLIASAGLPAGRILQGATRGQKAAQAAKWGAGYGALEGALSGGESEDDGRLMGAGRGAAIGAVAAPVLGRVVEGVMDLGTRAYRAWNADGFVPEVVDDVVEAGIPLTNADDLERVLSTRPSWDIEYLDTPTLEPLPSGGPRMPLSSLEQGRGMDERQLQKYNRARQREKEANVLPEDRAEGVDEVLNMANGRQEPVTTWSMEGLARRMQQEATPEASYMDRLVDEAPFSDVPPVAANTDIPTDFRQNTAPAAGYTGSIGPGSAAGPAVSEAADAVGRQFGRRYRSREATFEAGSDLGMDSGNFDELGDVGDISAVAARGSELAYETSMDLLRSIARNGLDSPETRAALEASDAVLPRHIDNSGEFGRALGILGDGPGRQSGGSASALVDAVRDPVKRAKVEQLAQRYADDPEAATKILRDLVNPRLKDRIFSFRYNMMLSSPRTQIYNIAGTGGNIGYDIAGNKTGAWLLGLPRKLLGDRNRVTAGELLARWEGAAEGRRRGWALAKEGFLTGRTADQVDRAEMRRGAVGKFELPVKAIAAQDEFFRSVAELSEMYGLAHRAAYNEGLDGAELAARRTELLDEARLVDKQEVRKAAAAQAKAEGLKGKPATARIKELVEENIPLQIKESAGEYAKRMRFQDDPSKIGQAIEQYRSQDGIGPTMTALVVPFVRTPDSLVRTALRHSPLGVMSKRNIRDWKAGGAQRDEAAARVLLGSAVTGAIAHSALNGGVTGEGPRDYEKRRQMELNGWQANSIWVPGAGYVSYEGLEPLALLLSGTATTLERWNEGDSKSFLDKAALQTLNAAEMLLNSSWSEGLQDTLAMLEGRDENGRQGDVANWLSNIVSSFTTPAAVRQVNQSYVDPVVRDTKGDGSIQDRVVNRTMAGWPGLSDNLPAQVDILGRAQTRPDALGPDLISRLNVAPGISTPVTEELDRLMASDPEGKVLLKASDKTLDGLKLKAEDAQKLQAFTGAYVRFMMEDALASPEYAKMTDAEKRDEVKDIIKDARKWAKEDAFPEAFGGEGDADTPSPSPTKQRSSAPELVEGDEADIEGFPFGYVTSMRRTAEGNRNVGGVSNSRHLSGEGLDIKPSAGVSMSELAQEAEDFFGPDAEVIVEGDHVHVQMPGLSTPYFGPRGTAGLRRDE